MKLRRDLQLHERAHVQRQVRQAFVRNLREECPIKLPVTHCGLERKRAVRDASGGVAIDPNVVDDADIIIVAQTSGNSKTS